MLNLLKSKDPSKMAISNCVHPRGILKGGGNASLSYVVRRQCHARWESPMTVADIKKYLKENKDESGGLLSQQEVEVDMAEWQNLEVTNQVEILQRQLAEEQARAQAAERRVQRMMAATASSSMGRTPKARPKPKQMAPPPRSAVSST